MFLDFSHAYNSVNIDKLINILKERVKHNNTFELDIIIQMLKKSNIKIGKYHYQSKHGLPQGSCLSPQLFNIYIDSMISELMLQQPNIELIAYADDLISIGKTDLTKAIQIFTEYNLQINKQKCTSFVDDYDGIPRRKTFKYLGVKINDKGDLIGFGSLIKLLNGKAKKLTWLSKRNPKKVLMLYNAMVGSHLSYWSDRARHQDDLRHKVERSYLTTTKIALNIPKPCPPELVKAFRTRVTTSKFNNYQIKTLLHLIKMASMTNDAGEQLILTESNILNWQV